MPFCGLVRTPSRKSDPDHPRPLRRRTMSIFNAQGSAFRAMKNLVNHTVMAGRKPSIPNNSFEGSPPSDIDRYMSSEMRDVYDDLYNTLRGEDKLLSRESFADFLTNIQGVADIQLPKEHYDQGEFCWVLWDGHRDAVAPLQDKDLSKPITQYFISSSHNTYLEGNQWTSRSTAEAYRVALLKGCRCIEIDVLDGEPVVPTATRSKSPKREHSRGISGSSIPVAANAVSEAWEEATHFGHRPSSRSRSGSTNSRPTREDISPRSSALLTTTTQTDPGVSNDRLCVNSEAVGRPRSRNQLLKGEPIVAHAWAPTAPCGFREVCEAIRDTAFKDNDMPLIVSLQVEASPDQQEVMVRIMKEVWQDLLLQKPLHGCDPKFRVPQLGQLRSKILVKVKKPEGHLRDMARTITVPLNRPMHDNVSTSSAEPPSQAPVKASSAPPGAGHGMDAGSPEKKTPPSKICESLSSLAIYTPSETFKSLDAQGAKKPGHIFSINESVIEDLHAREHRVLFTHNKSFFVRAYPAGFRVGFGVSSNPPSPDQFWRAGVQMVALNWQYADRAMMLNDGMFADEKGWVLKPPTHQSTTKDVETLDQATPCNILDLTITVFAAQHIPTQNAATHSDFGDEDKAGSSSLRPVVTVKLHVGKQEGTVKETQGDEGTFKQETSIVKSDHPNWGTDGEELKFCNIRGVIEEISFVRIKVDDYRSVMGRNPLAWACIRLDRLQTGYRFISLKDMKGNPILGGKLFVKIDKRLRSSEANETGA